MIEIPVHRAWPARTSPPSRRWPRPASSSSRCRRAVFGEGVDPGAGRRARQRDARRPRRASRSLTAMTCCAGAPLALVVALAAAGLRRHARRGDGRRRRPADAAAGDARRRRRSGPLRRPACRRGLWRLPARALHDRAQSRAAARRDRRSGRADAGRRNPVARARRDARRGESREMVSAGRRAGRAGGAVPVCAAAARRALRDEGRQGRLCADAGGGRGRQPRWRSSISRSC